jgi:hypothetical protein
MPPPRNQKLKRSGTILTSDLLSAGEPAARRRRSEPSPTRFGGRGSVGKAGGSDRAAAREGARGRGGKTRRGQNARIATAKTGLAVPPESIRGGAFVSA